jgi:DNA polymerase-4/DNA polymerase IV (DinB-like DNA polymerase)
LKDVLLLIAQKLSFDIRLKGIFCRTVTLKVTYADMKQITRAKSGEATDRASEIYDTVAALLDKIDKRSIRLVGISLSGLTATPNLQMSLFDTGADEHRGKIDDALMKLQLKYGRGIIKTANELRAEKRIGDKD